MSRKKRWAVGPGFITETPQGTFACYVSLGHRRRRRAVLKTFAEAKAWILAGSEAIAPDRAFLEDALRARAMLPDTLTIEDCARFWCDRHKGAMSRTTITEAWEAFNRETAPRISGRTLAKYRNAATRLADALPGVCVGDITTGRIEEFLRPCGPAARNNLIAGLSAFFNFCVTHGMADESPLRTVRKARIRKAPPAAYSIEDAKRILDTARRLHPPVVAYFALGLFAGLRPEEAFRMRPGDVRNGYAVLREDMTKTGDARTVPIQPNLAAWLDAYPIPDTGFVERHVKAVRIAFGGWKIDGCRHSYATYLFEMNKDAAATAATMGHVGTEVFYRHYRAMAAPGDGRRYFGIMPPRRK